MPTKEIYSAWLEAQKKIWNIYHQSNNKIILNLLFKVYTTEQFDIAVAQNITIRDQALKNINFLLTNSDNINIINYYRNSDDYINKFGLIIIIQIRMILTNSD